MTPLPPDPAASEELPIALPSEGLLLVACPAQGRPAWPLRGRPLLADVLPAGARPRVQAPTLLPLGDLPRPPGAPDRPCPADVLAALARATGPAAMDALAGIAEIGRRTSARLADCGLPALHPDLPFHLDLPGPHASLPVLLLQRGAGVPLLDAPPDAYLAFVALLAAIRVRVHGAYLAAHGSHLLFSPHPSSHARVAAARAADRLEAARAAHPSPEAFVMAVLDPPGAFR